MYLFLLIYTVRPCLIDTCHAMPMPCSDHAVLLKATAHPSRDGLWAACPHSASSGYHVEFHVGCYQKHTILRCRWSVWNQTMFVMDKEKNGRSTLQKRWSVTVGPAVRIFPAPLWTFMKDTALLEHGRGTAWHVWINGMAWARRAMCELAFNVQSACYM